MSQYNKSVLRNFHWRRLEMGIFIVLCEVTNEYLCDSSSSNFYELCIAWHAFWHRLYPLTVIANNRKLAICDLMESLIVYNSNYCIHNINYQIWHAMSSSLSSSICCLNLVIQPPLLPFALKWKISIGSWDHDRIKKLKIQWNV